MLLHASDCMLMKVAQKISLMIFCRLASYRPNRPLKFLYRQPSSYPSAYSHHFWKTANTLLSNTSNSQWLLLKAINFPRAGFKIRKLEYARDFCRVCKPMLGAEQQPLFSDTATKALPKPRSKVPELPGAVPGSQRFARAEGLPREVAGTTPACQGQHQMPSAVTINLGGMWRVFWTSLSFAWLPPLRRILSWQGEQEKPRSSSAQVNSLLFLSAENSVLINTPIKFPGCATVFSLVSFQAPYYRRFIRLHRGSANVCSL